MMPPSLLKLAARILCCPDCGSGVDQALQCVACGRSCAADDDGILNCLPASMSGLPKDRAGIRQTIESSGPGERGALVVQYEQAFHDEQALYYDKLFADPQPLLTYYQRLVSRQIYSYVKGREFVADLCCGTGKSSLPLLQKGLVVAAIDVSREMLRVYRSKCMKQGCRDVLFIHADASRPPLAAHSCPAIMMIGGLHHIRDQKGSVAHCLRALAQDGVLIFHEPIQTGTASRTARILDNLYAVTDPGRIWRAVKRRLGIAAAPPKQPASGGLCEFTPYEQPFHSADELLALLPGSAEVVALRSQGVISFHQFAPPVQRTPWLAKPLAAAVVQIDDWLSGDARRIRSGDALFAACRKR